MPLSPSAPPTRTTATSTLPRPKRTALFPATVTLAVWRLRQVWRLILITELGMIAAVMLICTAPLFSQVAVSGGLRSALLADPNGSSVNISIFTPQATPTLIRQAQPAIDQILQQPLTPYLAGAPTLSVSTTFPFDVSTTAPPANKSSENFEPISDSLLLVGRDMSEIAPQIRLLRGRLPQPVSAQMEVALTQVVADSLRVTNGSLLYMSVRNAPPPAPFVTVKVSVVGIFAPVGAADVFYGVGAPDSGGNVRVFQRFGPGNVGYPALTSNATLLGVLQPIIGAAATSGGNGPEKFGGGFPGSDMQVTWRYPLAVDRISSNDIDALASLQNTLDSQLRNSLSNVSGGGFPNIDGALQIITNYRARAIGIQVVVIILLLQVLALVLLFVSMMAGILVERQGEAIALLRSRGAFRRQIFGALATQGLGMSLLALIIGPLVAIPLVRLIAQLLLDPAGQQGLFILDGSPLTVAWSVRWFALVAVVGAAIAILIAILRAASRNVLALRRESARSTQRPLWQRLNLDLVLAVIAATGYGLYIFIISRVNAFVAAGLSLLSLIAPFFLLLACALLFLRFFPLAMRGMARLATRRSGATSMLALSQMARAPRESSRMLLQLALSTAFMIFTLIFIASQLQHLPETTMFRTVADFSGTLSSSVTDPVAPATTPPTPGAMTNRYRAVLGVTDASVGLVMQSAQPQGPDDPQPMTVVGVNPGTFAQTAYWSERYSAQPLHALTTDLLSRRAAALKDNVIPAVVDDALAKTLHLSADGHFSLKFTGRDAVMNFLAVARVAHIPPVVSSAALGNGGLLVDYDTYATIYNSGLTATGTPVKPNTVWLAHR